MLRFTVVIPNHGHERYLGEAIRSALKCQGVQKVIVVNDHSPSWDQRATVTWGT